jgi:hypothetical protein
MHEERGAIGPNDCFVTDNVMSSSRNLIGGFPLTPINFADLCEFIEMAVLHERIIMTLAAFQDSPLEVMVDEGVVTATMFKNATPPGEAAARLVSEIYEKCFDALSTGATFGRGIMDLPDSYEEGLKQSLDRIKIGEMMLAVDVGKSQVEPDAVEAFGRLRQTYKIFTDYADAVFGAAQHFHVNAYAGASEIAYAIQRTVHSIPSALYGELRKLHKDRVDRFLASAGFATYDIPPFALIVLSRCKRREDIVPEVLRAREEFRKFRETCTEHAIRIRDAAERGTTDDIIDLQNDLDRAIEVLTKEVKASAKDSRFVYRVWDVVKVASPWGITRNVLDRLVEHDISRQHLRTVNGLTDIWKKLKKASSYEAILRSDLFPNEFAADEFAAFNAYLRHVRQYFPVGKAAAPGGAV